MAHWHLLAGDNLDQEVFRELKASAPVHVSVERARPDFQKLLAKADLSVSQGGYNTVMDVVSAGCRNLIVPFADAGESEQTFRARCFAERGLVNLLPDTELTGERLAKEAVRVLGQHEPPGAAGLDMNGAARSAELIIKFAEGVK